ncbi:MAG TPA: valine--tRNA ligase [Thermoplasmata archaeon]|nr:valine--tRNA ligase [Thermoplasmata archaeon]
MSREPLPPRFDPTAIEPRWQAEWRRHEAFRAPDSPGARRFSLILPPPNVTGVLTIGHMLGNTVMDVQARWHRMRGDATLWVPSVDHAGVSTQMAVRKALGKEGIRLETLPAEEVRSHIEAWKVDREAHIRRQLDAGGFSVDWSRYRYTMDPLAVRATREVFVRLHRDGLVYRGERIVNWDPKLRTALSDLEVLHREETDELLTVKYPWADGSPGGIAIATVRPETIFGDVAVAVHPDDDRYRSAIGRTVRVPLTDRTVRVIADPSVDATFGTGAVKVTPRHDALDFAIYRAHASELELLPSVLDLDARLSGPLVPEQFRGMDREKGRAAVTEALVAEGCVEHREPYRHSVGHSERSDARIEPFLSMQWFVRMRDLAPWAVGAVRDGTVRLHPDRWERTFFAWMESLEDWCISRQVVWGHPIPVYYCDGCGATVAAVDPPLECPTCHRGGLRPDPDVLDTWFTSWLWPFVSLGWPEKTEDLDRYYPTNILVTGRDIVFFWVARMIMAGGRFTGKAPFSDVVFTGLLRDELGRKLSKHLGNSPDPLEVFRERGADALRFALVHPNPVELDGPFTPSTLDGGRNFLTKLWNVVRFVHGHLAEGAEAPPRAPDLGPSAPVEHRWILARWRKMQTEVDRALGAFETTAAASALYQFLWHEFADVYLEWTRAALAGDRGEAVARESRHVLTFVTERTLRTLHPFVPHVTEELWHALPHSGELLALAPWPSPEEAPADPAAEVVVEILLEAVRALRHLRSEHQVPLTASPAAFARPSGPEARELLERETDVLRRLAKLGTVTLLTGADPPPAGARGTVRTSGEYFLEVPDAAPASDTLLREQGRIEAVLEKTRGRLADAGFRSRAPPEVVAEAEEKVRELSERLGKIAEQLGRTRSDPTPGASA